MQQRSGVAAEPSGGAAQSFPWAETGARLAAFAARFPLALADDKGRAFVDGQARLWLPFALPPAVAGERIADYLAHWPRRPGRHCVLLLQAGAVAMGFYDDDALLRHKADKKYVVRGQGKAQPTHRKTKGKSRYGSRLRLQNWQRLLQETNKRLRAWWQAEGPPDQVFVAAVVRVLPELFAADPPPPFVRDAPNLRRIPLHVHVPDFGELQRVRYWLGQGRVEAPLSPQAPDPSAAPDPRA